MNKDFQNLYFQAVDILANTNSKEALMNLYALLSKSFPLEGILLCFSYPPFEFLPQFYLIQKNSIQFLGNLIPLDRDHALHFRTKLVNSSWIYHRRNSAHAIFSYANDMQIQDILPLKERSHLFSCMNIDNKAICFFRMLGTKCDCFTDTHEEILASLNAPLSFVLTKLFYSFEVQNFFKKHNMLPKQTVDIKTFKTDEIIAKSPSMHSLLETITKLSIIDESVLILGETGTGKELIANAIQANSIRKNKPFIKVNCGAIPENLIDSVLFGYEKGSFTGANKSMAGKFEQAHGGTLFLDELGELSLSAQVRLLRVLQDYTVDRIGSIKSIPVDVRIIAATNKDLKTMMLESSFREDLFYRISTFSITIPALRDRKEDIAPLCNYFIDTISRKMQLSSVILSEQALTELMDYHWPGNVRELQNVIRRALVLDGANNFYPARHIDFIEQIKKQEDEKMDTKQERGGEYHKSGRKQNPLLFGKIEKNKWNYNFQQVQHTCTAGEQGCSLEESHFTPLNELVKEHIIHALQLCRGQIYGEKGAAKLLGLHSETLRKRVIKMKLKH